MSDLVHLDTDDRGTFCEAKMEEGTKTTDTLDLTTCLPCLEALIKQTIHCMMWVAYEHGCRKAVSDQSAERAAESPEEKAEAEG